MSSTPPIPRDDVSRASMNFPAYLYPGAGSLDYPSHILPTEKSYHQKFDGVLDTQTRNLNTRSDPGSSGREEAKSFPRSTEDGNYRMLTEAIKTRDMNLINMGLDAEYKRRENSTPHSTKNGEYDSMRNHHGFVSESSLRNFTQKPKDHQAPGYPDMVSYSSQARLQQHTMDPRITAFSSLLPNSGLLQPQMAQTFPRSYPYDMLPYLNPLSSYTYDPTRDVSSYPVDRRTSLPKNFASAGHLGLSQTSTGLQPLPQGYQERDIANFMNTESVYSKIFPPPYNSSQLQYSKRTGESDPFLSSRHSASLDGYSHYTNNNFPQSNTYSSSSHVDQSRKYSPSVSKSHGTYPGSSTNKDFGRITDPSVIDLTSSNSPNSSMAAIEKDNRQKQQKSMPPPLVRESVEPPKENGVHGAKEFNKNSEFSSTHLNKVYPSRSPFDVDPQPLMSSYPVAAEKVNSGSLSDQSSQHSRMYDPPSETRRSHTATNSNESSSKHGSQWPHSGKYHHPQSSHLQSQLHSDAMKNSSSLNYNKSKNLPHQVTDLAFNYPEGATQKLPVDRTQHLMRYPPAHDNGLPRSKMLPWAKKDESKLSPYENHIMDTARDGKMNYKRNYDFPPRAMPGPVQLPSNISASKVPSLLPDYQHSAAALAEKFSQDATGGAADVARNTVIQSVPKPQNGEKPDASKKEDSSKDNSVAMPKEITLKCNENLNPEFIERGQNHVVGTSNSNDRISQKTNEKISPSKPGKPGRKRKSSHATKEGEQKPKRKYTKKSEIWKKRGQQQKSQELAKSITDAFVQQPAPEATVTKEPEQTENKTLESDSQPRQQCGPDEPARVEKRQRKSGDMDEYFYGWFTDEETENDDSSDEDYSCPTTTTVTKYRGLRGQGKQRSTRRMSMRHNDAKTDEESYDFRHKKNKSEYNPRQEKKRRGRKKKANIKMELPTADEKSSSVDKTVKETEKESFESSTPLENVQEREEKSEKPPKENEEFLSENVTCENNNILPQQKIEEITAIDQFAAKLDEVTGELCQMTHIITTDTKSSLEQETHKLPVVEKQTLPNEISLIEPVRKKRKYTRRLDKDGLPIKRAKKSKVDLEKGTLGLDTPRKKRPYRKISARWFKKTLNSGDNNIADGAKQISPTLGKNCPENNNESCELDVKSPHGLRRRSRETSQSEDTKKSPNRRKLSATQHYDTSTTTKSQDSVTSLPNDLNSLKDGNEAPHVTTRLQEQHHTIVEITSNNLVAKTDVPVRIKKKPGRKPGWRKYPQPSTTSTLKEDAAGTGTSKDGLDATEAKPVVVTVKKKYKKPKGDGLTRFGRRKRGRRPKHLLQKVLSATLANQRDVPRHSTPNKILKHHPRRLNMASKHEKKVERHYRNKRHHDDNILPKDCAECDGDSANTSIESNKSIHSKIFPRKSKKNVHEISEVLQSQEYDYDFKSELSLYNNGDDNDEDFTESGVKSPDTQDINNDSIETPTSPSCESSRPQTPVFYQHSPFPTHLKKLCCNSAIGETQLHKAARMGFVENIRYYLESGTTVNQTDNAGYTALHEACVQNNLEAAMLLLQFGADVNKNAVDGTRPLHDAVEYDHLEVARLMLSCGADPMLSKFSGRAIPHMIRSQKMRNFLEAYFKELKDLEELPDQDKELEWKFPCSSIFDKPTPHCYNTLDEASDIDNEQFIEFELFDEHPPTTYLLQPEEESERSNYCLLDDYLKATEKKGRKEKSSIRITTIPTDRFVNQVKENQMQNKTFGNISKPDLSSKVVELVALNTEVSKSTGAEIVQLRLFDDDESCFSRKGHEDQRNSTESVHDTKIQSEKASLVLPVSEKAQILRLHTIEPEDNGVKSSENSSHIDANDVNFSEATSGAACNAVAQDEINPASVTPKHFELPGSPQKDEPSTNLVAKDDVDKSQHKSTVDLPNEQLLDDDNAK